MEILIISISKLLGNYNILLSQVYCLIIISISKLLGNYNGAHVVNNTEKDYINI